jgi:hypothetical protein
MTRKFSFRTVLSLLTTVLVIYVIYANRADIVEATTHLADTNIFVLLLLIPEQLFMYYACGEIFFSYLRGRKDVRKLSRKERLQISTELNFVNHAVPAGGVGGLTFLTYRMRPLGVSAGQSSFLYIFRYAITTVFNYVQALVAIVVLLLLHAIPDEAMWVLPVSLLMNIGVSFILLLIIFISSSKKRLRFFASAFSGFVNTLARIVTFGYKKSVLNPEKIDHYLLDINESVIMARREKRHLGRPIKWGIIYSFCEISTYWIVAISLGHPEILPQIMIGETIGSVFDGIVPYGLYELGMAGVMIALGVDFSTATIVTVMTRVAILLFTIISGYLPYRKTIIELTKNERSA